MLDTQILLKIILTLSWQIIVIMVEENKAKWNNLFYLSTFLRAVEDNKETVVVKETEWRYFIEIQFHEFNEKTACLELYELKQCMK